MVSKLPDDIKACVFDAYGTLFDFGAAARGCRDVLGHDLDKLTILWRDKQLQYTWLRAVQGRHVDFWQVTLDALDYTLETLQIVTPNLRDRTHGSLPETRCFPGGARRAAAVKGRGAADGDPVEWIAYDAGRGCQERRHPRPARRGPHCRRRWSVQARSQGLSARCRTAWDSARAALLFILKLLGTLMRLRPSA